MFGLALVLSVAASRSHAPDGLAAAVYSIALAVAVARFRGTTSVYAPVPGPPKVRAVTAWIITTPDRPADADNASLDAILSASPELAAVTASVRTFAAIMTERRGRELLEPWMTEALATAYR